MTTIDNHTFNETKLDGGWVIDAGCRGWSFSYHCWANYRSKVYSLDIEDFHDKPKTQEAIFKQAALTTHSGETEAYFFGDGTSNFIKGINETPGDLPDRPCETMTIPCITLQDIYNEIGTDIDLLKLDIEGAEYAILENIEPVPKQITVEFHEHVHEKLHNRYIDKVIEHLCKFYECHLYIRHYPRYKYMDCLFVRKDIA